MSQIPMKAAPADKVIRAVVSVRTRGGFAAWNLFLLFLSFGALLFLGSNVTTNQMWMIVALFICWQTFAVFALLKLPMSEKINEKTLESEKRIQQISKKSG